MLAPVVSVVGYELRGHRHVARLLEDEPGAGDELLTPGK